MNETNTELREGLAAAAVLLGKARHVVVFTGAGISAESGIPTFRDPLTGLWARYDPETLETPRAFREDAALVWGWYLWRRMKVAQALPNAAHKTIATLGTTQREVTVITQNIDDLHERAGSSDVIHLHGSLDIPKCFACHRIPTDESWNTDIAAEGVRVEPPRCERCKGKLRPGIVWFGEDLPSRAWKRALATAKSCDLLLSIGTSGLVYPAAEIPREALRNGASVIHINPAPVTQLGVNEYAIAGTAGQCMPLLASLAGV
ncbi:NAD-dependent deacetylase [Pseudomonas sp. NFACC02]|uniref:SIR2 family NAD-dependent protein deacylase n=1 Tax=Pseudomonas sp. NFACC02 TaxID=1566250 RepID=UPI0008D77363|nr:NAD-dependent deacylase [Pseudomonas sp. NFACC02]SEQ56045.1 NAD-dependent deacetylase [Pseudomonas sp. NFACC02]